MSGWLARARTLLGGDVDSPEAGWVALNAGMFEVDRPTKELRFREALELARRSGDSDLEFATLAYLGASLAQLLGAVHGNQEAMDSFASITAGTVSPTEFFAPEHIARIMGKAAMAVAP